MVACLVTDLVAPRVLAVPASASSLGHQAVAFARRIGLTLDPEQELVLRASLGLREDGRWQAKDVGVNAPRQNGKGEILLARELFGLFELGEWFIVHSSHEFKTSERHFQRMERVIMGCPELLGQVKKAPSGSGRLIGIRLSHGDEAIELTSGCRIEFKTRTKSAMRGFENVSLLVLDEAMILPDDAFGSIGPTIRASKAPHGPQLWYAGSAVDREVHEHGMVWTRVRERGIAGADPSLVYAEWSLDYPSPDAVPEEVVSDPVFWRKVNFAIERGRVPEEHMEWELRSFPLRAFIVELLGVGDWPAIDGTAGSVISLKDWLPLTDPGSVPLDPVCLAFDVRPDRSVASLAAAGFREDGLAHVELIECRRGTGWVVGRVLELAEAHRPVAVVANGQKDPLVAELRREGIEVYALTASEYAQACGGFFDHVEQARLRHPGHPELDEAVRTAGKRELENAWAWSWRGASADIAPLTSVTLALFGLVSLEPEPAEILVGYA